MEEDIKVLEEFKTKGYAMLLMKYGDRNKTNLKLEKALENLIRGYRELELFEQQVINHQNSNVFKCKNYIPKSKVEEQIQWLDNDIKNTKEKIKRENIYWDDIRKIRLKAYNTKSNEIRNRLQKLLEEE